MIVCTLVTLYFAKEVPLIPNQAPRLSDSAPLLDDHQQVGYNPSKSRNDLQLVDNSSGINSDSDLRIGNNQKSENHEVEEDKVESFSNSPGAVLVNLLTSLRHLPPAMHSVLVVMALTWVCFAFLHIADMFYRYTVQANSKFLKNI